MTNNVNERHLLAKKSDAIGFDKFVIGSLVLGFAALVIYQVLYCATCYGASVH